LETSFRNGALLHASLVEPWNSPGLVRHVVGQLGRTDATVRIRMRALPGMLGWGLRFVRNSAPEKFFTNTRKNLRLALHSLDLMCDLQRQLDLQFDSYARGSLQVFRDTNAAAQAATWAARLGPSGLIHRRLTPTEAVQLEPALRQLGPSLAGAIHFPSDQGGDAYRFCTALERSLRTRGAQIRYNTSCASFHIEAGRIIAVTDQEGGRIEADTFLLAAGSYSAALAQTARVKLPVRPVKGYSITVPRGRFAPLAPHIPVVDAALHMAVVPVGTDRIRVAGTADFAGYDTVIEPASVANLMQLLRQLYPAFAATIEAGDIEPWTGLRPMSPDGVPIIGRTSLSNLFLNTGHGHLGWTLATGSAKTVADIIVGAASLLEPADYSLDRFA
jgi:D-amino-acid dehydrogenase